MIDVYLLAKNGLVRFPRRTDRVESASLRLMRRAGIHHDCCGFLERSSSA